MTFWVKESSNLSIVDRSLEAPLDAQDGYLTPNDRFFVCNSGTTPIVDAEEHIVHVHGDGVADELEVMRNTEFYVLRGNDWPAGGIPITELNLKSSLALPWPARLPAGDHVLHGYARG